MTPERWQRIQELYEQVISLPPDTRSAYIQDAVIGDAELRREVESLVRSHERAENFIEEPAIEVAAQALGQTLQRLSRDQQIGRYRIIGLLGAGGMGEVYRAVDTELEREVAIKILPRDLAGDPDALSRFKREAKAVAALSHPNILGLYDFGFDQGFHFAVLELLEGETLASRLRNGPLPWRKSIEIAIGIAEGLTAAHAKGTVHRDIKPDNLFLTKQGQVKILDFGIAQVRAAGIDPALTHRTIPGTLVGSPLYASPEQLRGERVGPQSDIFNLGCVLYEMLTSRRPFERETAVESMAATLKGDPPRLSTSEEFAEQLELIVQRSLSPNPSERFGSASDLAEALKSVLGGEHTQSTTASANRWRWALPVAAILLLTAAAVLGWRATSSAPNELADSIAILPLLNERADPELEYLSDGITENLINRMSELSELRVIARTTVFRYKNQNPDPQRVGRELNVRRVLTGKVVRQADSLIVQIDLVNTADGKQLWGDRYDEKLPDLYKLPERMSAEISHKLQLKLTTPEKNGLIKHYTENPEAYRLYLLGRYHWNKRTAASISKSIEYFEQAIETDPLFALAYSGLADSYAIYPAYGDAPPGDTRLKAKAAALKALEIDNTLAEANATLASLSNDEWNWSEAEKRFRKALELKPGYATAHQWYSEHLAEVGRVDEAVHESQKAYELDPLSIGINLALGGNLYIHGDYDQSIDRLRKALELDPDFVPARIHLILPLLAKSEFDTAMSELKDLEAQTHSAPAVTALLGYALAQTGRKKDALEILQRLTSKRDSVAPFNLAVLHFGLGNIDRTFEFLNKACDEKEPLLPLVNVEPFWATLRTDARFQALQRRMGLGRE